MLPKLNPNLCLVTSYQRKHKHQQEASQSKALQNKRAMRVIYLIVILRYHKQKKL